jgi:glycosyltransferase involved in cell wall biosynthesis
MKISVITVCLNAERTIGLALESFLKQSHPDKELLVIDGASSDDTLRVVGSFPSDCIRVVSEADRGIYDAMNKGLRGFTGEAVGFLNSDDRFADPGALAAIDDALGTAEIVFGDLDFVSSHDPRRVVRRWRTGPFVRGSFRRGWMPAHPTFYCRRAVAETVGEFDLRYSTAADYDYMLRCLELTQCSSAPVGRVLVDMLHGGRSSSGVVGSIQHNFEALQSRRRQLSAGLVDYALFAKPLRKVSQLVGAA